MSITQNLLKNFSGIKNVSKYASSLLSKYLPTLPHIDLYFWYAGMFSSAISSLAESERSLLSAVSSTLHTFFSEVFSDWLLTQFSPYTEVTLSSSSFSFNTSPRSSNGFLEEALMTLLRCSPSFSELEAQFEHPSSSTPLTLCRSKLWTHWGMSSWTYKENQLMEKVCFRKKWTLIVIDIFVQFMKLGSHVLIDTFIFGKTAILTPGCRVQAKGRSDAFANM